MSESWFDISPERNTQHRAEAKADRKRKRNDRIRSFDDRQKALPAPIVKREPTMHPNMDIVEFISNKRIATYCDLDDPAFDHHSRNNTLRFQPGTEKPKQNPMVLKPRLDGKVSTHLYTPVKRKNISHSLKSKAPTSCGNQAVERSSKPKTSSSTKEVVGAQMPTTSVLETVTIKPVEFPSKEISASNRAKERRRIRLLISKDLLLNGRRSKSKTINRDIDKITKLRKELANKRANILQNKKLLYGEEYEDSSPEPENLILSDSSKGSQQSCAEWRYGRVKAPKRKLKTKKVKST